MARANAAVFFGEAEPFQHIGDGMVRCDQGIAHGFLFRAAKVLRWLAGPVLTRIRPISIGS